MQSRGKVKSFCIARAHIYVCVYVWSNYVCICLLVCGQSTFAFCQVQNYLKQLIFILLEHFQLAAARIPLLHPSPTLLSIEFLPPE